MYIRIDDNVYNFPEKPTSEDIYEAKIVDGAPVWVLNFTLLKNKLWIENQQQLTSKITIKTSKGKLKLKTPIGDLSVAVMGLLMANLPLYSKVLRLADGNWLDDMQAEEFKSFYLEIVQKYQAIDKRHTDIEQAINSACTIETLEGININYEDI